MSLFKVCTFWSAKCGDCETNYDSQLLRCCRFGIDETEKDYIVVGSHSGYLSVFKPNALDDDELQQFAEYKPTDQLLEIQLPHPIIQISAGKFLMGKTDSGHQQLAVLHPSKLAVYSLQKTEGFAEHGNQFKLILCFEHKFSKLAFAFCHGHFGGYRAREFFCVTHMDSSLTLCEQDGIVYESHFDGDRNIPSKMVYNSRTDAFVMVSSFCDIECYRYQDLNEMSEIRTKNVSPAWSVCIGEYALDIQIQQISESECIILVLCENAMYGINDQSTVRFIKRFDYSPKCFTSFVSGWYYEPDAKLIVTVISDSGTMLIYSMANLVWAAQLADVPVAICRSNLDSLAGAIVTLGETGKIDVAYLGSEPQLFQVPPLSLQKMNFEKTQRELVELEKEIKAGIDFSDVAHVNASAERDLVIDFELGKVLETLKFASNAAPSPPSDEMKMVLVSATLKANVNLDQIQIQFHAEYPIACSREVLSFDSVAAGKKVHADAWAYVDHSMDIVSTSISVIVSFINCQSIPRVIEKKRFLPLTLFYRLHQPQKDAANKFTLAVERVPAPNIVHLFQSDFQFESDSNAAIGFRSIHNGEIVTIVSAKNSNRVRIQSDSLPSISALLEIFIERLRDYGTKNDAKGKLQLIATPQLPTNALIELVDNHMTCHSALESIRQKLKESSTRMRLLERRFFIKLDDKKSNSISGVLDLLSSTHTEIMSIVQELQQSNDDRRRSQISLSCGLKVFAQIIAHFNVPRKTTENLCAFLNGAASDYRRQYWEEMTAPALDMMNRVGPLARSKNTVLNDVATVDAEPFNFDRFKRHLNGVLDRLCRLASADVRGSADTDDSLDNVADEEVLKAVDEDEIGHFDANKIDETSEWTCDVKQTMELLPRL